MLALAPVGLALSLLLGDTHVKWSASVRNEARARAPYTGEPTRNKAVPDFEVAPQAGLLLETGRWSADLGYAPSFRLRDTQTQAKLDHSHRVAVGLRDRSDRRFRPYLTGTFSYGITDTYTLAQQLAGQGAVPSAVGALPDAAVVRDIQGDISAGADIRLTPLWTLGFGLGWSRGGGADVASRAILPLQTAVRADVRASYAATRLDTVGISSRTRTAVFSNTDTTEAATVDLAATYRRQLTPSTALDATLGAALAHGRPAVGLPEKTVGLPLVGLTLNSGLRAWARPVVLYVGALLTPFIDRFVGTVYERIEGFGGASVNPLERFSAQLRGGISRALGAGDTGITTGYGELALSYEGARWWRVDFTGRGSRVESVSAATPAAFSPSFQWAVGASVTFRSEGAL